MVSRLLLTAGVLLLLAAGFLHLYSFYAQLRWQRAQAALSVQFLPAPSPAAPDTPAPTVSPTPAATDTPQPTATGVPAGVTVVVTAGPTKTATRVPSPTPSPTPDDRSDPGQLHIPKLKVTARIVFVPLINGQWDVSPLIYDVGLLANTGFPGRIGNAAISGHVSLKGRGDGPFRWLEKLAPNDEIIVQQGDTRYSYRVRWLKVVPPTDVSVVAPTDDATLTLITCTDWDFLRAEYGKRLIVHATLVSQRKINTQAQ
jgi:sortase A